MTLYRGTVVDTPVSPFDGGALRVEEDGGVLVRDGAILARGSFAAVRDAHPDEPVDDLRGGIVVPGFVDTHVHYPQVRIIGGLGMPLLEWLDRRALPEEARLADDDYAAGVAIDFVGALTRAGTTSALVFGSHFPGAVDRLFEESARVGLRVTAGLVVSDRVLRPDLLVSPETAYAESVRLAQRWHGAAGGRLRYAVTPRFSLSCTDAMLQACGSAVTAVPGVFFTSHVNENAAEIAAVEADFGASYGESYDRHGLLARRSVLAHNVHPTDAELDLLAARGTAISHCPTSNSALGSGLFPMRRHLQRGVRFALGTDVGGGMTFSLLREALQAYLVQQCLGEQRTPLSAAHLLHLATAAGADALDLPEVGDLSVGKRFDAVWLRPRAGSTLDVAASNAGDVEDALGTYFALAGSADVAGAFVDGQAVWRPARG